MAFKKQKLKKEEVAKMEAEIVAKMEAEIEEKIEKDKEEIEELEEEAEEEKTEIKKWRVGNIPTQTEQMVICGDKAYSIPEALAELLNRTEDEE